MFVLNIARTHEELVNHVEILNFEEIAKILQSYPHPHFYHLVRLLIALASNRPLTPALNYEENMNARLRPMPDKRLMLNRREIVSVTQSPSSDDSHSIRRPNTVSIKSLPRGTTRWSFARCWLDARAFLNHLCQFPWRRYYDPIGSRSVHDT